MWVTSILNPPDTRVCKITDIICHQECWAAAKTKENALVVGSSQRGRKKVVSRTSKNLQSLARRFSSLTAEDYIGRISNLLHPEF